MITLKMIEEIDIPILEIGKEAEDLQKIHHGFKKRKKSAKSSRLSS